MAAQWATRHPFTRRDMLKGLAGLGGTAGVGALLAACGTSSHGANGKVNLVNIESDNRPLDNAAYKAVYDAFQKKYPDTSIKFTIIPWETVKSKMLTLAQGGALPDMGRMSFPADYAAAQMVLPLDGRANKNYLANFDQMVIDQSSAKGSDGKVHLYGLPWFAGAGAIMVNKTLFDKAGIKLPESWTTDEFSRYAKELSGANQWGVTIDVAGIGDPVQNFLLAVYSHGGKWVAGDVKSTRPEPLTFDSPETVAGIQWYANLYKSGYVVPSAPSDTYQQRDANFQSGKAAIEWQGPWTIVEVRDAFKKNGWELASMPLPKGPAGNPSWYGGAGAGIYTSAQKHGVVEQAWQWISFLSSDEGEKLYCKTNGMIPASKTARSDPHWANDSVYKGYLQAMENAPLMYPVWATGLSSMLDDIVPPLLQGVFTKKVSEKDMASQVQQQVIAGLQKNGVKVPKA